MRVILLQNISKLGNKYDVKRVADGYARNFLIPKGLVKVATEQTIKELKAQKAARSKEEQEIKNKLETLVKDLAHQEFRFTLKIGKKGEVFGSVTKDDIKERLLMTNVEVNLERPIKKLGEHQVEINLGKGVKTTIKVIIESLE
jgi:large subunit ribosomal protein L9